MAKKLWERVQEDIEKNRQASEQIRINVNNQFNENIKQNGEFDTNKHTYQMNDLLQSYKNTSKELYNDFKRANGITLWDTVKQTANDLGRVTENTWLGFQNGYKNFQQTLGRRITETQANQRDLWDKFDKETLEKRARANPEEANIIQKYINDMDNQMGSGKQIREEAEKTTQKIQNVKEKNTNKINENIENIDNPIMKKISELSPSIGQMAPSFIPGVGVVYATGSATGQYYDDAKQRGMSDDEADIYSGIMGTLDGTTEMIGIKNMSKAGKAVKTLIKGTGKEIAKEGLEELGKASIKTALKEYGIGIADNAMQEALIEPIQETVASLVGGQDKANWENMGQRMLQSGIDGGLVAAITGGAEIGIQSCVGIVEKSKRGETITQNELKNAVRDASGKIDAEKMIIDSVQQQVNKYKDYNTNKPLDSVSQQWLNRANNIINENNPDLQQNTTNNPINPLMQQTTSQENKVAQNGNVEQTNNDTKKQLKKQRLEELKSIDTSEMGLLERTKIRNEIKALEQGYNSVDEYKEAERLKEDKAKQEYTQKQERKAIKNTENSNYQMQHRPTQNGIGYDITSTESIGKDFYTNPENYVDMSRTYNQESYQAIKSIEGNPEAEITVYRASPVNELNDGDWISLSKEYATMEAQKENVQVNEFKVKAKDIQWAGDDINEFGYFPNEFANNQQTVYNNTESEGGINGQNQFTNKQEISKQYEQSNRQNRIIQQNDKRRVQELFEKYQRGETDGTSNSKELLRNQETRGITEQEVKKTLIDYANKYSKTELNENEIKLKNIINNLGGNVVFYEYGNNNIFEGLADKSTFYIDTLNESKTNNIFYHELTHFLRQNNNEIYMKEIQPIVEKIASDFNYQEAIFNYANSSGEYFDVRKLDGSLQIELAEEVVADQIASMYGDLEADYGIDSKIKEQLKTSMDKILNFNENKQVPISESKQEEKVARILEKSPDKVKENDRKWAIFKANILDKGIVFEELSRKTKNRDLQGKWDYTLSASARGQNAIGNARYEFDSKTKTKKQISKSLEDIRLEVGNKITEFSEYMYHQLNIDRMTLEERFGGDTGLNYERENTINNKPVFGDSVTADMSKNIVVGLEQKYPKFKEYAQDVYDFLDANQSELVRNGVISQENAEHMKDMYPHYVPIGRVNHTGNAITVPLDTGKTGINSPIKSAKGGSSDILPLFDTIAQRTLQTYRASARNNFGIELKNTLNSIANVEKVNVDSVVDTMGQTIEEQGLLQKGEKGNNPTFTVFENGERITYEITKDMYDALKPVSDSSILGKTFKPLNKISNFRRGVLTEYNPLFSITNALKDAQDVLINSQHSAKTYSKFPEAYVQIMKKGYWYQEYIQNGGEQNSYFNANDNIFESDVKQSKTKNVLRIPLDKISSVNNVIELAPRLSEYIASREAGRSIETSMLDASRVTTNFKAGGDITKFANRNGATFLNASVQGAMQAVRNVQEANMKGIKGWTALACKTAIAGLPAIILNNFIWGDDDDYDELQDYVKDNYYCIAKYGDGKFVRIPKGRALATIQKIISSADKYITDGKEINADNLTKDFWECLIFAKDNLAPNDPIDNNVVSPVTQVMTNTSWYGEDIVPSRLQDKPEAEQYDETTDSFSIMLGQILNVSPYKINYLLDQYGGGISDVALPLMTKQAENNPIEDKFTTDATMKSKYPGEFFEMADELKINANSSNATDEDKVKYKYISNIQSELSDLYVQKREIQNSNMSDKDKKAKLKEVQRQINEMAKKGITSLGSLRTTSLTAKMGDNEYYKYNGEWTKLTDKEKEKNKNISLASYADYKNKVYNMTKEKKNNGEIKEEGQLKSKDKIKALLNSKCAEDEKEEIYKNYIGTEDKKIKLVDKLDFPLEEYLKYKQQDFENDKDKNGKSISGTGKQKVYDYLNNISTNNLSDNYKKIICKIEGINDYDVDVVTFINNYNSITTNEKREILENIGYEIDEDGYVVTKSILPIRKYIK